MLPASVPELETERLRLRGWRSSDVEDLADTYADPRVAPWLGNPDPSRISEYIERWLDHWRRLGFGLWAVEEKASGRFIGRVGLMHHDDWTASDHDAEIGWALSPAVWGRGYATEAARAVLAWARERPELRRIISITLPTNIRSRRVMEKLGLAYRGTATWHGFDQVWYSIDQ